MDHKYEIAKSNDVGEYLTAFIYFASILNLRNYINGIKVDVNESDIILSKHSSCFIDDKFFSPNGGFCLINIIK